jgi:V/A-type H+-transporting ATPase subunit C
LRVFEATLRDPIKYGFINGRITYLETKLLAPHHVERLIEAENLEEVLRILTETDYARVFEEIPDEEVVERNLTGYLKEVLDSLEKDCPDRELFYYFRLKYDFQNLKTTLKLRLTGESSDTFSPLGNYRAEELNSLVLEERYEELPELCRGAAVDAVAKYEETKNPQQIDILLDRAYFAELLNISRGKKRDFIISFTTTLVDLANLKTFLRARVLQKSGGFLEGYFIDGGEIPKKELVSLFEEEEARVIEHFRGTDYDHLVTGGFERSLSFLEVIVNDFVSQEIAEFKYLIIGPEPVLRYLLWKENEVRMIKLILLGKIWGVPKDRVRAQLREMYA